MLGKIFNKIFIFLKKSSEDSLPAYAAQTTFFVLLSVFPSIMLLIMMVSKMTFARTNVVLYLLDIVPDEFRDYVVYMIDDIVYSGHGSLTVVTVIMSLWSAGKGIQALTYGLNKVYRVEKNKNFIILRLLSALYTLIFLLLCIIMMLVFIFGTQIAEGIVNKYPSSRDLTILIMSLRHVVTFVILFVFLLLIYFQLPGRRGRVKHEIIGAATASVCWMMMTKLFSLYIRQVAQRSYMYGSLTTIILIIVWLYIGMQIVLYGAQINYFTSSFIENCKQKKKEKENKISST